MLIEGAAAFFGGEDVAEMPLPKLQYLITITQYATDVLLNEIERRGELTFNEGVPIVPYESDYSVETILSRPEEDMPDLPGAARH